MTASEIGERVRHLREQRGLAIHELAAKADVSPGTVLSIEHGDDSVTSKKLRAVLAVFDLTLAYGIQGGPPKANGAKGDSRPRSSTSPKKPRKKQPPEDFDYRTTI